MSCSNRRVRTVSPLKESVAAILIVGIMACLVSPSQAEVTGDRARRLWESAVDFLSKIPPNKKPRPVVSSQSFKGPSDRAMEVKHLRLCPRRLLLYVGESFTLVPLPLDQNREVVHGASLIWETKDANLAGVTSWGEVSAIATGHTQVIVTAGTTKAQVNVEVRAGARPTATNKRQADLDWDEEHARDCDDPEATAQMIKPQPNLAADVRPNTSDDSTAKQPKSDLSSFRDISLQPASESREPLARPAMIRRARSDIRADIRAGRISVSAASTVPVRAFQGPGPILDGGGDDPPAASAAQPYNAVGSPHFAPTEHSQGSSTKTKNLLGSYDYVFNAPVLGLPGRGLDVNLALTYNSRVWSLETSGMIFNYTKGWPAPGWTLGYGRLIDNYDGAGNWLLIQPDGTRTHLQYAFGSWNSTDGSFLQLTQNPPNGPKLRYPDGTLAKYDLVNNRYLPTSIRNRNGDIITIAYRDYDNHSGTSNYFPVRWAISQITDTLARIVQFHYYGDPGYPEDTTGAKPKFALAAITAPDQAGGIRTVVKLDYQTITLQYSFSDAVDSTTPPSGSQITVLKRIYYPSTGRGYLLTDYSTYGMARRISVRNSMTAADGTITDGTQVAYTKYNYTTIDPNDPYGRNQVGLLNDSPQYTTRSEWWQDKIDGAAETVYTYSRSNTTDPVIGAVEVDKVSYPNGMDMMTTSGTDQATSLESFGHVVKTEIKNGTTTLRTSQQTYVTDSSGGQQLSQVTATDEAANTAKTTYDYYPTYGRVQNINEYGFSNSIQRKTTFSYSDDAGLIGQDLIQVVSQVKVRDGSNQLVAQTDYEIDNYSVNPLMDYPILAPGQTHDYQSYGATGTTRGNVTKVTTSVLPGTGTIVRSTKFDVFGNVVRADVSCCQVKNFSFLDASNNPATYYSQPMSVTDGTPNVAPFLTTSFQYDFNTGLLTSTTDPNGQPTSFIYDLAWRLLTVNSPTGASATTKLDRDSNNLNDLLSYFQQVTYREADGITTRTITSRSWFDGAGRMLRAGTAAGASPTSYDAVKTEYDTMGRVNRQSNPYSGDANGNGSPAYWTTNTYDLLSRVTTVTLPDNQTIQTSYNGATVTVTDQVGRKRQSQVDGLGRLISVTEQDPTTGALSLATTYSYDTLDNLTGVNQGGQTRGFSYDSLGRVTSQSTPEGGAVSFTYTDFSGLLKRTDARNVETHYKYDTLNRPTQVWYTGLGGDDAGTVRPALPASVAATADVVVGYKTASPGNGAVDTITDGAGSVSYVYDSLGRTTSKTRTIDGNAYQTQYQYNQANQLALMIYPSGKRVRMNFDARGRLNGEDKVDTAGGVLSKYVRSVAYSVAGQVTSMGIGEIGTSNAITETFGYSADRLQLTSQSEVNNGGTTLMSLTYGYQATAGASGKDTTAGNSAQLMSITGTINGQGRNETYTYDDLGRLASASGFYSQRNYSYDRWGNRTAVSGGSSQSITLQPQPGAPAGVPTNRIATVNGVGYTYDLAGNMTNDGAHTYQYDGEGRVASVDSGAATYFYDSANRRVKKVVGTGANAVTTYYVWEGAQVIAEYSNAPAGSGGMSYYLADRLSTRMITDTNGAFKGTQDHLPFGQEGGTSGISEKHRFTNYERDGESNSDYAMNRQHQYANGRFIQPDPIQGNITTPQSLNRYAYSLNDPINLIDPVGLDPYFLDASKHGPGVYLDGVQVMPEMWGMVFNLWAMGAADILPNGAWRNKRGEWITPDDHHVSDYNDLWRSLPFFGFSFSLIPVGDKKLPRFRDELKKAFTFWKAWKRFQVDYDHCIEKVIRRRNNRLMEYFGPNPQVDVASRMAVFGGLGAIGGSLLSGFVGAALGGMVGVTGVGAADARQAGIIGDLAKEDEKKCQQARSNAAQTGSWVDPFPND